MTVFAWGPNTMSRQLSAYKQKQSIITRRSNFNSALRGLGLTDNEDSSEDDNVSHVSNISQQKMRERKLRLLTSTKIENHTKVFASMCPDEILDHVNDYHTREYFTTLMLGDVSGFTDLTEKYTKTGQGGPSKLTEILNSYIGAMVQEILSHKGDVLKFSGDAFIVMWKVQEDTIMRDIAVEAMQTACIIQKHFGTFDTDVGIVLKVKLAIASGKIFFTSIGDPETMSYYIITGNPVWDVKAAEGLCRGGDIIVASSSWQWANPSDYVFESMPDGIHTLLLATTIMWEPDRDIYEEIDVESEHSTTTSDDQSVSLFDSCTTDRVPESEAAPVLMNLTGDTLEDYRRWQVDYSLRPKVNKVAKAHMENALRCYMVRPVVHAVEMDEPIEYLTEMRQVVILFINVITIDVSQRKLIHLVDNAYKIVCGIVDSMQGCVNKTSLFDKDLMFLCIFGLRGDKHELESQIGLRCAAKLYASLSVRKNIASVAIGVTTGMTYCGVVGHLLRREYTVIGMAVNKAARLMCAYPHKVVCDRDSFLLSRLEARHFILQKPVYLKGISKVGPIYEFLEQIGSQDEDTTVYKYPILGREEELNMFVRTLVDSMNFQKIKKNQPTAEMRCNALIIRGEPRSGKTRLLNEMVKQIPSKVHCHRLSLIHSDHKSPYILVQLMLSIPFGFTASSTPKEREDKITTHMGKMHYPHLLCSLNEVFNVNFGISKKYSILSNSQKREIMENLLSKLIRNSFTYQWVIAIDNAEYSDEESMILLPKIMKEDLILFVMAFGQNTSSEFSLPYEVLKKAEVIDLVGLDKWYHAGLACQFLEVKAISAELEKVVQEKSFGNPGWIESYLICLLQSGELVTKTVNKDEFRHLGLVCPPDDMIQTSASDQPRNLKHTESNLKDGWKMYQSSYGESTGNVTDKKVTDVSNSNEDMTSLSNITICLTSPTFVIENSDVEMKMDVVILKMFDSLSSLDQLLLRSAAVLGETFNRYMLQSFLESTSEREIALAIKRLFEIRILGCAMGDFKRTPGPAALGKFRHQNMNVEIRCACTGIVISEACADLPKYASCGLIRFKISMFRNTMYRLLTENHKVEIHDKALKYLQQKTRRCVACGSGHFVKLLGVRYDDEQREKRSRGETLQYLQQLENFPSVEKHSASLDTSSSAPVFEENLRPGCFGAFKPLEKSPTTTFSSLDFSECQCDMILITMYTQVVDHCRSIGRKDKMLIAILEFVEVSLSSCNIAQAKKLLTDAESVVNQMKGLTDDEILTLPYLKAKIQTLRGRCCLESGQIELAQYHLNEALLSLGYNYPRSAFANKLKAIVYLEYQKMMLKFLRHCTVGTVKGYYADFSDQLANCLAQLYKLFKIHGWWDHCRLAAVWGLNAALKSNQDFFVLCTSYAHMLVVAHHFHHRSIIPELENHAINICCSKEETVELQELKAIAELYNVIFYSRWMRREAALAIRIGSITLNLCSTIRAVTLKLSLLPQLIHMFIFKCDYGVAVSLLQELESIGSNDMDKSGTTWYYALCIDLQLECGLAVVPFRRCEQYYQEVGSTLITLRDPSAEKRYFTNMWLWCVRNDDWDAATVWGSKIPATVHDFDDHAVLDCLTAAKKLEGLLILYVHRLDMKNAKANIETHKEIRILIKVLGGAVKSKRLLIPRYILLKAYYNMIRNRSHTGLKLLSKARKIALQTHNNLMYQWGTHCLEVWTGVINPIQRDFWKEHCTLDSVLDWHEVDMKTFKPVPFSLPLPKYPH